jgi:exodeoxyribonuclease VII small subunit
MGKKKDKKEPAFEELMKRLDEIATQLESGELGLEKAIDLYEEGVTCYKQCSRTLAGAEKKVEILVKQQGGELVAEPFEEAEAEASENETESAEKEAGKEEEEEEEEKDSGGGTKGKSLF